MSIYINLTQRHIKKKNNSSFYFRINKLLHLKYVNFNKIQLYTFNANKYYCLCKVVVCQNITSKTICYEFKREKLCHL